MTTPYERTQSVVQTREFLQSLRRNPELPESVRNEAHRLLRHFLDEGELSLAADACPQW
jgi:hypothetical protein